MLQYLREKNPDLPLYAVTDPTFSLFGRVVDLDTAALVEAARAIEAPAEGAAYLPTVEAFERLRAAGEIRDRFFGTMPIQLGYCWGHNRRLNGAEWHICSEVNVAVTDLVLLLAHRRDMRGDTIDSAAFTAFYVPMGTAVEMYATSLHFCPCQVTDDGFGCVVALPVGTNLPPEQPVADPLLFRRNKWIVAHNDNPALIARGVVAGIGGENTEIHY